MFKERSREKKSSRRKKEEPSVFFRWAYFFILILFFGVAAHTLLFSDFMRINHFNLEGTKELDYALVYAAVKSVADGKYLGIFPKNNFLLFSKAGMRKKLSDEFRKIRSVAVKKNFPDTVNVKIEERTALIIWCANEACYVIDEQGFAYAEADFNSDELKENNLVKLIASGARPAAIGEQVFSAEYAKFIFNVRRIFKEDLHLETESEYVSKYRVSEEIEVKTKEEWKVYLSSRLSLEKSARTLKTFLEKEINEETRKKLEYVDLRVENKIYYKIKNEENSENSDNLSGENAEEKDGEKALLTGEKENKKQEN